MAHDNAEQSNPDAAESRRRFLKKAATIAIAAPVMESISREGLLVRSAHAQTVAFQGFNGPFNGILNDLT